MGNTLTINGIAELKSKIIEMFNLEKIKLKDLVIGTELKIEP